MRRSAFFAILISLGISLHAVSQEPAATPAPPPAETEKTDAKPTTEDKGARPEIEANYVQSEAEAEALGPKNKTYMEKFYEFREINKKLTALKTELPTAAVERQEKIVEEYWPLFEKGGRIYEEMITLGFEALEEAPNRNPFVNNVLYGTVEWEYRRENYEKSYATFKRIVPHGIGREAQVIYVFAGLSALIVMELDDATAWLDEATNSGFLEKVMKNLAETKKGQNQVLTLGSLYERMPVFKTDWAKEQEIRKAETEAGEKDPAKKLPRVLLKTNKGDIVLELFENEAPNTVANFISLVEKKFYDKVVFHRVLPLFMAQGGDPTGTGRGGPGYTFDDECRQPNTRKHFRGSISMANAGTNTNGSQFFLTFIPTSMLDGRHTVFGRIVEGIDVLSKIQRVDPEDEESMIPELDRIEEAKVLNKRDHEYKPVVKNDRRNAK